MCLFAYFIVFLSYFGVWASFIISEYVVWIHFSDGGGLILNLLPASHDDFIVNACNFILCRLNSQVEGPQVWSSLQLLDVKDTLFKRAHAHIFRKCCPILFSKITFWFVGLIDGH